ncbi:hypothetical protein PENSPDRAFT_180703 [Peniophora sp. CONT]|nr:hypothetical protein PENSPDRAFT_180703 [Peniophora sp. CONT]
MAYMVFSCSLLRRLLLCAGAKLIASSISVRPAGALEVLVQDATHNTTAYCICACVRMPEENTQIAHDSYAGRRQHPHKILLSNDLALPKLSLPSSRHGIIQLVRPYVIQYSAQIAHPSRAITKQRLDKNVYCRLGIIFIVVDAPVILSERDGHIVPCSDARTEAALPAHGGQLPVNEYTASMLVDEEIA